MKPIILSAISAGALTAPAFAHDHPVPHTHDLPFWALALIGLAAAAFGTWATLKYLAYLRDKS
ncbi:MAG: hypothetical protein AAF582_11045 [Pseudomonadota bacterium]